jgi:hypothetical protein
MCLALAKLLLCGLKIMVLWHRRLTHNGPAVCFSRRNPTTAPGRVLVPRASGATKLSRCKEGLARVFAVMVQILLSAGAVAVQFVTEPRIYHRLQSWVRVLAQCRGTKPNRSQKTVKVYWSLIACRCAYPGARTITKLS